MYMEVRGQLGEIGSFLVPCGFWPPNSGCQPWWQMPLLMSHLPTAPYLLHPEVPSLTLSHAEMFMLLKGTMLFRSFL